MEEEKEPNLRSWERRLLIIAFGGWAAVVAAYGQGALNRIDRIVETMERERDANSEIHRQFDKRLIIVERDHVGMGKQLDKIETQIDEELRQGK